MKICVIGAGYVGLVTATCFAELGQQVICVDKIEEKINQLNDASSPIYEPGLEELIEKNLKSSRLSFSSNLEESIKNSEIIYVAVGTPMDSDGSVNLDQIREVVEQIAKSALPGAIIVTKSTVPVGTGDWLIEKIKENRHGQKDFEYVSNPEFLKEGSAVNDFMQPDRIVIGSDRREVAEIIKDIYEPLDAPIIITNVKTAELIKYASNAFLATKISFINEIANLCDEVGSDVNEVSKGMGFDPRIGPQFLQAGIGYGGSCFPKDIAGLKQIARDVGYHFQLLTSVIEVNNLQVGRFLKKVENNVGKLNGKKIGVLGLAFKPNTNDMRQAPSIPIIKKLVKDGAFIAAYDPAVGEEAAPLLPKIEYCSDVYEACRDAEAILIITDWDEFRSFDLNKVKSLMKKPIIIDGRNIFEPAEMKKKGFIYDCIGRCID